MLSPSRVGCLISLLVASGCAGNSGDGGQTGAAQRSGTSTGSSGAQSTSGGTTTGNATSGSGANTSGGSSGVVGPTGSSGLASGAPSGSSGSAATGAGSGSASGVAASGLASGAPEGGSSGATTEGGTSSAGPFTCTMVLGVFVTSQWFNGTNPGGATTTFLMDGVDATRWEGKMQKYAYIEKWIDPTNALWSLPTANPCAVNATTPDRVAFVAFRPGDPATDQDYQMYAAQGMTEAGWEMLLNSLVATIKMKYSGVKEIDIFTMGRAPNNVLCANNNDPNTVIQPYEDDAFQAVAAASNGLIVVGPKYYVPDCNTSYIYANDSDYTTTAANYIAKEIAAYYVAHP
jgi:hypothetical protein